MVGGVINGGCLGKKRSFLEIWKPKIKTAPLTSERQDEEVLKSEVGWVRSD